MSMKTFTFVKGIVPLLTLALFAVSTSAQTVTLNPSAAQNISTGGTVNFTATRSSNSQTWPGGNGQFTYTWSSNPAITAQAQLLHSLQTELTRSPVLFRKVVV